MTRPILWSFVILIGVFWNAENVDGCSCFPTHPQAQFCNANFVFRGKVLNEKLVKGQQPDPNNNFAKYVYRVRVLHKLRGFLPSRHPVRLVTAGNGALCGVRLTVGQKYILSGYKRRIGSCNFIRNEDDLSFQQLRYLYSCARQSYRKNCACKDIRPSTNQNPVSPQKGCKLPKDNKKWQCYFRTGLCKKRYGTCQWKNLDCD